MAGRLAGFVGFSSVKAQKKAEPCEGLDLKMSFISE